VPLLCSRFRKGGDPCDNTRDQEYQRDDGPDNSPALRRATIPLSKYASIGGIDLSQDEIIALDVTLVQALVNLRIHPYNIPYAVQAGHYSNEENHES
jgi:hypothetical protein